MKKVLNRNLFLIVLGIMFVSCNKEFNPQITEGDHLSTQSKSKIENNSNEKMLDGNSEVTISCSGNCESGVNCSLEGKVNMESGIQTVACACSNCVMTVESTINGKTTTSRLINSTFEVNYLKFFHEFMKKEYVNLEYVIKEVKIIKNDEKIIETYLFEVNGKTESIMYVSEISGEVKQIDCTGTCDCREQYNLNTGVASCSCADCMMSVTTVAKK